MLTCELDASPSIVAPLGRDELRSIAALQPCNLRIASRGQLSCRPSASPSSRCAVIVLLQWLPHSGLDGQCIKKCNASANNFANSRSRNDNAATSKLSPTRMQISLNIPTVHHDGTSSPTLASTVASRSHQATTCRKRRRPRRDGNGGQTSR